MLAQLTISNFAIVRELEIDFQPGMTAITGETGAGKSIAIDALGLCLGNRADGNVVRLGAARADICARFSLADTPSAREWLEQNQLDDSNECLLRRVINADGRSRGFINGTAVPVAAARAGATPDPNPRPTRPSAAAQTGAPKALLDAYADEPALLAAMSQAYQRWHQSCRELAHHQQQSIEREARKQLLQYQLKELNEFAPQAGEFEQTDAEYKRLANSGQLLTLSQQTLQLLADSDENNMLSQLYSAKHLLLELAELTISSAACWTCWKRLLSRSAKPATSCATTPIAWISIPTACTSWNSACRAKSAWRANTRLRRKSCRSCINSCWMNNSCFHSRKATMNT